MNYTTAIFILNEAVRAVKVAYDDRATNPGATEAIFKTLDKSIKVDDIVAVPSGTRHGVTTAKVTAVDVDVDLEGPHQMKWIVQRIDMAAYEQLLKDEEETLKQVREVEMSRKRAALRNALLEGADPQEMKALPLANFKEGK